LKAHRCVEQHDRGGMPGELAQRFFDGSRGAGRVHLAQSRHEIASRVMPGSRERARECLLEACEGSLGGVWKLG
jgi:hypothetical protein